MESGGGRAERQAKHGVGASLVGRAAPLFNLCVLSSTKHLYVDLSVEVKAIKGEIDQGGGLVWRYRDANNYYITRWNPLETNFRVYHVVDGKRTQLANADITLPPACGTRFGPSSAATTSSATSTACCCWM